MVIGLKDLHSALKQLEKNPSDSAVQAQYLKAEALVIKQRKCLNKLKDGPAPIWFPSPITGAHWLVCAWRVAAAVHVAAHAQWPCSKHRATPANPQVPTAKAPDGLQMGAAGQLGPAMSAGPSPAVPMPGSGLHWLMCLVRL